MKFPYPYTVTWQNKNHIYMWQSCKTIEAARRLKANLEKQQKRITATICLKLER